MEKFISEKDVKLSDFLREKYNGQLTTIKLNKLFAKKDIKVNGARVKADCFLKNGDVVECYYNPPEFVLEIVYQDENVIICNKPSGITSENYFAIVNKKFENAIFTHRLDRNTSGIMVFALNDNSYNELFKSFKERTVEKYYHCLINGFFNKTSDTLKDYIFKDAKKGIVKIYKEKKTGCLPVVTEYKEVERGEKSSVLKVHLVTGRTHQIRAHLAFYGHFIIGDGKYGNEKINNQFKIHSQLLVASHLIFHFEKDSILSYLNDKVFSVDYKKPFEFLK